MISEPSTPLFKVQRGDCVGQQRNPCMTYSGNPYLHLAGFNVAPPLYRTLNRIQTLRSGRGGKIHFLPLLDLSPANQSPMLLHSAGQGNLFLLLCAHRRRQLQLGQIMLDSNHACTRTARPNVEHEHLILAQLADLALFFPALHIHTQCVRTVKATTLLPCNLRCKQGEDTVRYFQ